jgi:hypothetical protein
MWQGVLYLGQAVSLESLKNMEIVNIKQIREDHKRAICKNGHF